MPPHTPAHPVDDSSSRQPRRVGVADSLELDVTRYRSLLEAAPDALIVVDDRGRMVLVNAQAEKRAEPVGYVVKLVRGDGPADGLVERLRDGLMQPCGAIVVLRDREAEARLDVMVRERDALLARLGARAKDLL